MFFCATYHTMRTALRAQPIARCRAPSPAGCDATASPFDQWSNSGQRWRSKIVVKKSKMAIKQPSKIVVKQRSKIAASVWRDGA